METVYCPSCRGSIPAAATICPLCGMPTTSRLRMNLEADRLAEEAEERAEEEARRTEAHRQWQVQENAAREARAEADRLAVYNKATGKGVCPNCKSPNVLERSTKEGQNVAGAHMACCLGCFLSPLAFLALPFMGGRKVKLLECQYCSNRWRL